jgi:hypothetical protein
MITSGCQNAARIAEASVAASGHLGRSPRWNFSGDHPRASWGIEQETTGRREGGKQESLGFRALRATIHGPATSCLSPLTSARFQGEYFWFWSSKNKNALSLPRRPSRLPAFLFARTGPRHEPSGRQQPEACRTARPRDATAASARKAADWQPKAVEMPAHASARRRHRRDVALALAWRGAAWADCLSLLRG